MSLTVLAKDEHLGLYRGCSVALFDGDEELPGRQAAGFTDPDGDGVRFITNAEELRFPPVMEDHTVDQWGVFDAAGNLRAMFPLDKAREIMALDNAVVRPGTLRIEI